MIRSGYGFLLAAGLAVAAFPALAGEVTSQPDGSTKWQAGIDGVVIEWAPDGSLNAVSSTDIEPVAFPDRQGQYKARVIAEEKAKAAIVRFMKQMVTNSRIVADIDNDLSNSTRERQNGSKDNVKRVDTRTLISSLTEVTTSFASGSLPGIIILDDRYDPKAEEYSVTVGFSKKTRRAAQEMRRMTTEPDTSSTGNSPTNWLNQPGVHRTYPNKDWK